MARIRHRPTGSQGAADRRRPNPGQLFVCAECKHAQLFAVQPRFVCTSPGAPLEGVVLFAGRPACAQLALRTNTEPVLSRCSPGLDPVRCRSAQSPGVVPEA